MRFHPSFFAAVVTSCLLGLASCTSHSNPLVGWHGLGKVYNTEVPETIKRDAQTYFQTLPEVERNESKNDYALDYYEDGTGQHAVVLDAPNNGENWHYALIYDRNNRRIKVLTYSTGSYMS